MKIKTKKILPFVIVTPLLLIVAEALLYLHAIVNFSGNMVHLSNHKSTRNVGNTFYGISDVSNYTINHLGLRGKSPSNKDFFAISFGNSTTECLLLDDKETWSQLTMDVINTQQQQQPFTLNISAKSGLRPYHNVMHLNSLLDKGISFKLAIFLPCFIAGLDRGYRELTEEDKSKAFANSVVFPKTFPPRLRETLLYQAWKDLGKRIITDIKSEFGITQKTRSWKSIYEQRMRYQKAKKSNQLSDFHQQVLSLYIKEFRETTIEFIKICQQNNIQVILLSQPVMYKENLEEKYIDRYILRSKKAVFVPTPRLYHEIAGAFAREIEKIATQKQVHYINLYAQLSSEFECYYDQYHFNEYGAKRIAEIISNYILNNNIITK
ncbi:SGNH/GDSL hydrolase family protein [Candidatus Uabimicrobium amorphum]|uniref:SGNH hydrolase-type esterase domain-containing protein n=1 Tax=Uabimicrobium amorphum TaxID=2596890 RepID=A0A5S9F3J4_UABAM|nr:SGNH/GDSL hydrolase family protein [Candidatus Uabimicrobium amorphum]BBM84213.1 hypothetical protein UABAM_02569 [Candidatus Uabimicrobium amorphum]